MDLPLAIKNPMAKRVAATWSSSAMPRPSRPGPVEELDTPVLTFTQVEGPWGVALNQRGEVVVADIVSLYLDMVERNYHLEGKVLVRDSLIILLAL